MKSNTLKNSSSLAHATVIPIACLFAVLVLSGCSSLKVSDRQQYVTGTIPRPGTIWVHDFVARAADIPAESMLSDQPDIDATSQTAEQIAQGVELGHQMATNLVGQISQMGMHAEWATLESRPQVNDLVIRGYLICLKEGNAKKRVLIGFGEGASELRVAVEAFQMTVNGLRKISSGTVNNGGSKSPGAGLGVVTLVATHNPVGLIVSGGKRIYGEKTGSSKVEGRGKAIVDGIAKSMKQRFKKAGWID